MYTFYHPRQIPATKSMHPEYGKSMQISRKPIHRNRLEVMNTENKIIIQEEARERQPDAAFTQEIDGRPYHVRVYFPEVSAATLQEKVEHLLRAEISTIADKGSA